MPVKKVNRRTAEPQNIEYRRVESLRSVIFKNRQNTFLRHSTFDIHYSIFAFKKHYQKESNYEPGRPYLCQRPILRFNIPIGIALARVPFLHLQSKRAPLR